MATKPNVTDVKASSHVNSLVLEITPPNELGEQEGGPTTDILAVEGIIGTPEGRSLGSPGDIRFRQDVPEIYQKATGERTLTGWRLNTAFNCTTIFEVGPGCQFDTIAKAYTAAKNAGHNFANQAFIVIAPQAGGYIEDLKIDRSGIHFAGAGQGAVNGGVATGGGSLVLPKIVGTVQVDIAPVTDINDTRVIMVGLDIEALTGKSALEFEGSTEYYFEFQNGCAQALDTDTVVYRNTDNSTLVIVRAGKVRQRTSGVPALSSVLGSDGSINFEGSQCLVPSQDDIVWDLAGDLRVSMRDSGSDLRGTVTTADTSRAIFRNNCSWTAGDNAVSMATIGAGTQLTMEDVRINSLTDAPNAHILGTGTVTYGAMFAAATTAFPMRFAGTLTVNAIQPTQLAELIVGRSATFVSEIDNEDSGAADTIDWNEGNKQLSTITANVTYTFTDPPGAANLMFRLVQGGAGGFTATWPVNVLWPGGVAPTLSAGVGDEDLISFYFNGTDYYGGFLLDYS